jgi:hypothetical protein
MVESEEERACILRRVERNLSEHNRHYPGRVMLVCANWPNNSIQVFYKACCNEVVEEESYAIAEACILAVHLFDEVVWKWRTT